MIKLKSYAGKTSQGPYLQINEDDYDVDLVNKLFLIFDGFGGAGIGDGCVSFLKETIKSFYVKFGGDPDSTFPFFYSYKYLLEGNALVNCMNYAHLVLKRDNLKKDMSERGGSSVIGVSMSENILTFAAVGNCSAYIYRKGELELISPPDCLRHSSQDDYYRHLYTAPMSGFGLFDELHLQINELRILENDLVVLMTDGVYSRISRREISQIMDGNDLELKDRIDQLFDLSNSRENLDNQTTVLLQF